MALRHAVHSATTKLTNAARVQRALSTCSKHGMLTANRLRGCARSWPVSEEQHAEYDAQQSSTSSLLVFHWLLSARGSAARVSGLQLDSGYRRGRAFLRG